MQPVRSLFPRRGRRPRPGVGGHAVLVEALVAGAVLAVLSVTAGSAHADPPGPADAPVHHGYLVPVEGDVADPFRAPPNPYGPGNRGIDYTTAPLSPVRAAAAGAVIFAGPVAGTLHVTIRHSDGLRTTYSFLASIEVHVGQHVEAGALVGRTTEVFHFGVRDQGGTYLDPALLFGTSRGARLIPGGDDGARPDDAAAEAEAVDGVVVARSGPLQGLLARLGVPAGGGAGTLAGRTALWAHLLVESAAPVHDARIAAGLVDHLRRPPPCTPAAVAPPRAGGRRILVEVGGIGSTSDRAAVDRVDADALGYAPGDVVRFSYAGGRVAGPASPAPAIGPLGRLPTTTYDARDSQRDLGESAARLADLLRAIAAAEPGVPVDVVAHSQGGVVARLALQREGASGQLPPAVQTLVTLGAPHQGAEVAAAVAAGRLSERGRRAEDRLQDLLGLELDGDLPAGGQLVPTSPVVADLSAGRLPPTVRFTSVGARGDLVVTANRTRAGDGAATVVPLVGPHAHDQLPGAPVTTREIALAVAGAPPTCRSLTEVAADLLTAERIAQTEARAALTVAAATGPAGPLA